MQGDINTILYNGLVLDIMGRGSKQMYKIFSSRRENKYVQKPYVNDFDG